MNIPEITIKNILYATDLSENARYAFSYAVSLANRYNAKITILHVIPEIPELLESHVVGYVHKEQWEKIKAGHVEEARESLIGKRRDKQMVRAVLDQFSKNAKENLGQSQDGNMDEIVIERGNPVEQILKQAESGNCDLIVMGTHGQGTLADAMMGSNAKRVLRRSKVPVLVVRLPENHSG